ncbi:uncharacterized protein LOC126739492 [Anthonomus grandis grandis]|uniref:uncharacterized protein LOC126739492 n=1 Tax=Anthonomus grandis grandis TaxID=2921223 RepID=UPI0021657693|nr:uncharacterized protein LOC126739492 [Anthonomus grandis grandis]
MAFLKIVAFALLSTIYTTRASVIAPLPAVHAVPAIRYTRVAPPSVLPFSAQVSTFTRNLHVLNAPYAAGVLPGAPAIIQRALPIAPAHIHPGHIHSAPVYPTAFGASLAPRVLPAPSVLTAPVAGYPLHAHGVVAPVGRSVHAVAPGVPFVEPGFAHASLLG